MNRKQTEKIIAGLHERTFNTINELVFAEVKKIMQAWHEQFPKRTLRFIDGMGAHGIDVDNRSLDWDWGNDDRLNKIFQPLQEVCEWYEKMQHDYGYDMGIDEIKFGPE